MSTHMLSADARSLLDRYRTAETLAPAEKNRLLDAVVARGARGDLPRFDIDVPPPRAPDAASLASRMWSAPLGKVLLGLGLAVAGATAMYLATDRAAETAAPAPLPAANPEEANTPTDPAPALSANAESIPAAGAMETTHTPGAPAAKPRAAKALDRESPATAALAESTIDEEMRLLGNAQSALRSGDARKALSLLDEHASRFPSGTMADTRDVAHMLALCDLGKRSAARAEADRFLAKKPGSPFADRVKRVCATP